MPHMTGIEFLAELNAQVPEFLGPFVLFTGEGTEDIAADGINAGATSYVQKGGTDTFEYLSSRIVDDVQSSIARRNSLRFDALTTSLGDPVYVIGTAIDVDEATEQYERLRRERDSLKEFVSVVSHDLRNPLTVAMSRAELLADADRDSPHVEPLRRNLARMEAIIEDLLALARAGEDLGDLESVSLAELSERCWETVATDRATITVEATGAVRADPAQLKRLLENLYRNAIEHGGNDVAVTVGETERGLYVADDGPGISADQRDRIFEAGYSTGDDETGFGLGIVERIAEAHGWEIEVGESNGGGARIDMTNVKFV